MPCINGSSIYTKIFCRRYSLILFILICLDNSVGRVADSYPACQRFNSSSRYQPNYYGEVILCKEVEFTTVKWEPSTLRGRRILFPIGNGGRTIIIVIILMMECTLKTKFIALALCVRRKQDIMESTLQQFRRDAGSIPSTMKIWYCMKYNRGLQLPSHKAR